VTRRVASWLCAALVVPCAHAAQLPRWEIGVGAAGLSMPDYRGSDERRNYLLPVPYFAYRLDWLKADRSGVRATLFDSDRLELHLSMDATPPVRSDRNRARQGMPDLKPMLEFGPALDVHLWRSPKDHARLDLRLPLRATATISERPQATGWVFAPRLNLDLADVGLPAGLERGWQLGLLTGPIFVDDRQSAYYYSVAPQYAEPGRPAFDARGGYAGTQFLASLSRRRGRLWIGGYARWDTLKGARFEASPLVRKTSYASVGFAVTWTIGRSDEMVETGEENPAE
jgi:outer membrane scaffolding protein for murein synthesis (MipA/OmpV family)